MNYLKTLLSHRLLVLSLMTGFSIFALAAAFIGEYVFGLEPCILCLYQRVPYAAIVIFGFAGAALNAKKPEWSNRMLFLAGFAGAMNGLIAFYHTGVEQKWWISHLEGCAVPKLEGSIEEIMAQIESTQAARCDEISWQDPVLGLSMANYNIMAGLGLAALAFVSLILIKRRARI